MPDLCQGIRRFVPESESSPSQPATLLDACCAMFLLVHVTLLMRCPGKHYKRYFLNACILSAEVNSKQPQARSARGSVGEAYITKHKLRLVLQDNNHSIPPRRLLESPSELAGLFSSCVEASTGTDSQVLETQFRAEKLRFQQRGGHVGFDQETPSPNHHPALDNPETYSAGKGERAEQVQRFRVLVQQLHDLVPPDGVQSTRLVLGPEAKSPDALAPTLGAVSNDGLTATVSEPRLGNFSDRTWPADLRQILARLDRERKEGGWTYNWILDRLAFLHCCGLPRNNAKAALDQRSGGFWKDTSVSVMSFLETVKKAVSGTNTG
ncbi:hypothetical protein B0T10DRAFT_580896 [Thelonectria olida]|uniref:Uncharacterized protein n=1 Tax=Thelonectria olida TaxID=1576542 RepID=A0A9P8VZF9_9HYPO|nr:hypothetical protein B0T10DRAFT_580896 [Thelonectria olida]